MKPGDAVMLRVKGEDKKMRFVPIEMPNKYQISIHKPKK